MPSFDVQAALKAGYNQDQINGYIQQNKLTAINMPTPTPTVAQAPAQTSPQPQDIASQIGGGALGFLGNILKSAAQPVINAVNTTAQENSQLPNAKGNLGQSLLNAILSTGNLAKNTLGNPKFDTNVASYAVPFGKGGNILSKVLAPGASVGFLQGTSQENATPQSVTGNALLGAGGAGLLHGILGIPSVFNKAGNAVEGLGNSLTQDVNKINLAPSVYGASQEKAVQQTINKIPGLTAAQKYQNLQPTMSKLADSIQAELDNNPKTIPLESVKSDFMGNLKDQLRTKNLSSNSAQDEINGYLNDLYENATGGKPGENPAGALGKEGLPSRYIADEKGNVSPEYAVPNGQVGANYQTGDVLPKDISTSDLFKLKQQVNQDYQGVAKKIQNGNPLNDREKVVSAARRTLDDIIAEQHPTIKQATVQQSHLYDAAAPLAAARNADHSIPIFAKGGIGIPSPVVQGGKTILGGGMQQLGKILGAGQRPQMSPMLVNALGLGGAGLAVAGAQQANAQNNNNQGQPSNPIGQQLPNESSGQNNQQVEQSAQNIHNGNTLPQSNNSVNYGTNGSGMTITPEQVTKAYLILPPQIADRVKAAYQAQFGGLQPADIQQQQGLLKETNRISDMIDTLQPNQAKVGASNLFGYLGKGDPGIQQLQAEATSLNQDLVTTLHRRGMSPEQAQSMSDLLIQPGKDSVQLMKSKIAGIQNLLKNFYPYSTGADASSAQ